MFYRIYLPIKGWFDMAIREGRCPNCGSILQLDSAAEKGHCLFCDAVFDNSDAFEIAANPSGVTFPNLPQPKYEGPSLEPRSAGLTSGQGGQRLKQVQPVKKAKPVPPPAYVHKEPIKLPDIRLSKKTKLRILVISLIVIAVIAGIGVPTVISRDQERARLLGEMGSIASFSLDAENAVTFRRANNSYLLAASAESISQAEMVALFKAYCEKRAAGRKIDLTDFNRVYGSITVKLVTPDGGYLIDRPSDLGALNSGSAVIKLDP
jgi:hypothetical protein